MATKILMASTDTETLAALDTELSACLGDMQAGTAGAWRGVGWGGVAWRGVAWRGVAWRGVAWRGVGPAS